jgi:hypothetical protein
MSSEVKYIGMDVHKEAIVIAVRDTRGHVVMESIVETKASSILQFIRGLQGELHVTWEEGTWAAWLYDLLKPHVHRVLVCNPRRNALLKEGSKNDKVDARKLADLLRTGMLRPVYHGEHGLRTLRELARTYQTLSQDLNRVMNRLKALYRGWGMACGGTQVYAPRYRDEWLGKIEHAGVRRRAELLYQQLDGLQALRRTLRSELLAESRKHKASKLMANLKPILAGLCASGLTYLCFLTWVHSKAGSFAEGQDRTDWIAIAGSHAHVLHSPTFWVLAIIAFGVRTILPVIPCFVFRAALQPYPGWVSRELGHIDYSAPRSMLDPLSRSRHYNS